MSVLDSLQRCTLCLLPETHETISFDSKGVCNICRNQAKKSDIDWDIRQRELDVLVSKYSGRGEYDYIVPFSGGKDSTYTLYYLMRRYPQLRPLVVRFNHGFLRPDLNDNCDRVFRSLGVDLHDYTPSWHIVRVLMLRSLLEKGDFCWHCHTGIFAYPMHVAIRERIPLLFWGEPSSEYTAYYSYESEEAVDEDRFNRFINLGISASDMALRLGDTVDPRLLNCFDYPPIESLKAINYSSVCLGSFIPWDVRRQVSIIQEDLGWRPSVVENVPLEYGYEKIECWLQGVRDYIKYIKRGYTRPSHLAAIDLRNGRLTLDEARDFISHYEGFRPPSLSLFLEYLSISEDEFNHIIAQHVVSPWRPDFTAIRQGAKTHDFDSWSRGASIPRSDAEQHIKDVMPQCLNCDSCS